MMGEVPTKDIPMFKLFLHILEAENNKCSYGALRLRTRLQGVNCTCLSTNLWSLVTGMTMEVPTKETPMF